MGNFIFSQNIVAPIAISARAEVTNYPITNTMDLWDLSRHFRCGDLATNDWLVKLDFGSSQSLGAIFLNDVNFSHVTIQGSNDDITYTDIITVSIPQDDLVQRYKVWVNCSYNSYRYWRIFIPSVATVMDSLSTWRIGTIVCLSGFVELVQNPSYGFIEGSSYPFREIAKDSGGLNRISLGDKLVWHCDIVVGEKRNTLTSDWKTINSYHPARPMVFYKNNGDISQVYLCCKDSNLEFEIISSTAFRGTQIRLKELV